MKNLLKRVWAEWQRITPVLQVYMVFGLGPFLERDGFNVRWRKGKK